MIDTATIQSWLDAHKWRRAFLGKDIPVAKRTQDYWLTDVHGAKTLSALFAELSGQRVRYDKIDHGTALTSWLLRYKPEAFNELGSQLALLLTYA